MPPWMRAALAMSARERREAAGLRYPAASARAGARQWTLHLPRRRDSCHTWARQESHGAYRAEHHDTMKCPLPASPGGRPSGRLTASWCSAGRALGLRPRTAVGRSLVLRCCGSFDVASPSPRPRRTPYRGQLLSRPMESSSRCGSRTTWGGGPGSCEWRPRSDYSTRGLGP
jgi:hypothetical protein